MRTTISIPDDLAASVCKFSGQQRLSKAITQTLSEYISMKKRLALLDELFDKPLPHSWKKIKAARRNNKWNRKWS